MSSEPKSDILVPTLPKNREHRATECYAVTIETVRMRPRKIQSASFYRARPTHS